MAFLAGKSGGVTVGVAVWKLSKWSLRMPTDAIDTTNFESSGYAENIAGITRGVISASGPFDSTAMAMTSGTSYSFTLEMSGSVSIVVTARVTEITVDTDVKDAVRVNISAESTGSFTAAIA